MREKILKIIESTKQSGHKFEPVESFKKKQIENAMNRIVKSGHMSESMVVAIMDITLFGSCKKGYLLTTAEFYADDFDEPIRLNNIAKVENSPKNSYDSIVTLKSGEKITLFTSAYREYLNKILNKIAKANRVKEESTDEEKAEPKKTAKKSVTRTEKAESKPVSDTSGMTSDEIEDEKARLMEKIALLDAEKKKLEEEARKAAAEKAAAEKAAAEKAAAEKAAAEKAAAEQAEKDRIYQEQINAIVKELKEKIEKAREARGTAQPVHEEKPLNDFEKTSAYEMTQLVFYNNTEKIKELSGMYVFMMTDSKSGLSFDERIDIEEKKIILDSENPMGTQPFTLYYIIKEKGFICDKPDDISLIHGHIGKKYAELNNKQGKSVSQELLDEADECITELKFILHGINEYDHHNLIDGKLGSVRDPKIKVKRAGSLCEKIIEHYSIVLDKFILLRSQCTDFSAKKTKSSKTVEKKKYDDKLVDDFLASLENKPASKATPKPVTAEKPKSAMFTFDDEENDLYIEELEKENAEDRKRIKAQAQKRKEERDEQERIHTPAKKKSDKTKESTKPANEKSSLPELQPEAEKNSFRFGSKDNSHDVYCIDMCFSDKKKATEYAENRYNVDFYRQQAKLGNPYAMYMMWQDFSDLEESFEWLEKAVNLKYPPAMRAMAIYMLEMGKEDDEYLDMLMDASEKGDGLATEYLYINDMAYDYTIERHLETGMKNNNAVSWRIKGDKIVNDEHYSNEEHLADEEKKYYYTRAAELGDTESALWLVEKATDIAKWQECACRYILALADRNEAIPERYAEKVIENFVQGGEIEQHYGQALLFMGYYIMDASKKRSCEKLDFCEKKYGHVIREVAGYLKKKNSYAWDCIMEWCAWDRFSESCSKYCGIKKTFDDYSPDDELD